MCVCWYIIMSVSMHTNAYVYAYICCIDLHVRAWMSTYPRIHAYVHPYKQPCQHTCSLSVFHTEHKFSPKDCHAEHLITSHNVPLIPIPIMIIAAPPPPLRHLQVLLLPDHPLQLVRVPGAALDGGTLFWLQHFCNP